MTLDKAIEVLKNEYEKAQNNPQVFNPLGYALYKAWRVADKDYERKKKGGNHKENSNSGNNNRSNSHSGTKPRNASA